MVGKIILINHYEFMIVNCDERSKQWFKESLGVDCGNMTGY
jgi:hypothetical protein